MDAALVVFLLVACYETVLLGGYKPYGPNNPATHALQFGVLLYFDQTLHEERDPLFLISVGVIFYHAGTVLINLAADYMMFSADPGIIWTMYMVQFILLILFNFLLAPALALAGRTDNPTAASAPKK